MSNLELCCDYYLRTFMFYSTHFGNKLHVLSFLFLAFVLFFTPFLLMNRNCKCYRKNFRHSSAVVGLTLGKFLSKTRTVLSSSHHRWKLCVVLQRRFEIYLSHAKIVLFTQHISRLTHNLRVRERVSMAIIYLESSLQC